MRFTKKLKEVSVVTNIEHCYLCNSDLSKDSNLDKQYHWCSPVGIIHFCSNCFDDGQSIVDKYDKISKCLDKQCDKEVLFKTIINVQKYKTPTINISFKNYLGYDASLINAPITKDGRCVGVITNVTKEDVYGLIWERDISLFPEFNHNLQVTSFELRCCI